MLANDGEAALDLIFRKYYAFLCKSIYRVIPDSQITEDIAQEVFYELWKKRQRLTIKTSLKAYLKRAALNKSLNYIRDQKIDYRKAAPKEDLAASSLNVLQTMATENLQVDIDRAIDGLPERCRLVFVLSRFEEMSYQQIAEQLNISIKTVENQISKALKSLRKSLAPYLSLLIICWNIFG